MRIVFERSFERAIQGAVRLKCGHHGGIMWMTTRVDAGHRWGRLVMGASHPLGRRAGIPRGLQKIIGGFPARINIPLRDPGFYGLKVYAPLLSIVYIPIHVLADREAAYCQWLCEQVNSYVEQDPAYAPLE